MNGKFLKNAPLKEVMFEIRWDLDYISEQKLSYDNGFEGAVLNFTKKCQQDFNELIILKPENIPPIAYNYRVTHRFYKIKDKHPLYQFGPGVFTVNDNNKNYIWDDFYEMIVEGVNRLRKSYDKEIILKDIQLRYIDRVSPNIFGEADKFDFLREHLQINAEAYNFVEGKLTDIQFAKNFYINEEIMLNIIVTTGIDAHTKEDVVEWHILTKNNKRISWEELNQWIKKSHGICSDIFNKMISKKLYEHFNG